MSTGLKLTVGEAGEAFNVSSWTFRKARVKTWTLTGVLVVSPDIPTLTGCPSEGLGYSTRGFVTGTADPTGVTVIVFVGVPVGVAVTVHIGVKDGVEVGVAVGGDVS